MIPLFFSDNFFKLVWILKQHCSNGFSQITLKLICKTICYISILRDFWILRFWDYDLFQCYCNLKEGTDNLIDNELWTSKYILFQCPIKRHNFLQYFYIYLNNVYIFRMLFHKIRFSVVVCSDFILQETLLDYKTFN